MRPVVWQALLERVGQSGCSQFVRGGCRTTVQVQVGNGVKLCIVDYLDNRVHVRYPKLQWD